MSLDSRLIEKSQLIHNWIDVGRISMGFVYGEKFNNDNTGFIFPEFILFIYISVVKHRCPCE